MFFQGVKISQRVSVTWSINFYCLAAMQFDRVETRLNFLSEEFRFQSLACDAFFSKVRNF